MLSLCSSFVLLLRNIQMEEWCFLALCACIDVILIFEIHLIAWEIFIEATVIFRSYIKKKNHSILERDSSMWCLEELTSHGVTESSKILSHSKEKHLENWKNTFFLILKDLWCAVKREKSKVHWKGENLMTECQSC